MTILPKKHITLQESLIGLGSFVFNSINKEGLTLDEIWENYLKFNNTKKFPAKHSFDELILSLDILFSLNKINMTPDGEVYHETN